MEIIDPIREKHEKEWVDFYGRPCVAPQHKVFFSLLI